MANTQQATEDDRPTCYFHFVWGVDVVLRPNGECPLCVDAPSDEAQLKPYRADTIDDCWDEDDD